VLAQSFLAGSRVCDICATRAVLWCGYVRYSIGAAARCVVHERGPALYCLMQCGVSLRDVVGQPAHALLDPSSARLHLKALSLRLWGLQVRCLYF
jgi:hypothetical protein